MIAVILPLSSFAQGVDFKSLTMKEAQVVAVKEKKMIFIDFYTTWCGPCKMMSSEVFTQDQVGEYFNRTFVNLKVDAEKGEGVELAKKYQVKAYPTFVVLRRMGRKFIERQEPVRRMSLSTRLGKELILNGRLKV